MNYNILSYFVYSLITVYVIYWVGKAFHSNGRVFILQLLQQDEEMTDTTNNVLLVAYYLFNIGYAIIQFSYWDKVSGLATAISSIATKSGILISILALTHYINMTLIYFLSKRKIGQHTSKTF